jgi:hypothetical protein
MQLRKIPLMELIDILNDLYQDGVDYIDISGTSSEKGKQPQDFIKITVRPDYITTDKDIINSNINVSRLSENDINDLI